MAQLKSDELNVIPIEQYFGEMELSEEEKEKRIDLAEELDLIFFYLFLVIQAEQKLGKEHDIDFYTDLILDKYADSVEEVLGAIEGKQAQADIQEYIKNISREIVQTTIDHVGEEYYTSHDRATYVAENEANTVANTYQLQKAITDGYTTKTWITLKDNKVRHTHFLADGETIGIYDLFEIGSSKMAYPKDSSHGAKAREIVNCRCSLRYGRSAEKE